MDGNNIPETSICFASLPCSFLAVHVYTPNLDSPRISVGNERV